MFRIIFFVLVFAAAAAIPRVWAVTVPDLYQADVPVADQSSENRRDAEASALREVLVKVTGDSRAGNRMSLEPILGQAESYVQQFLYHEATVPGTDTTELRIRIRFDPHALDRDLRALGLPVWGRERPLTLVWVVYGDSTKREWITPDDFPQYIAELQHRAQARGISIIFPLFDLQDTNSVRPSDVWGRFNGSVLNASKRYQPDTVLVGVLNSAGPDVWQGRWTAFLGNDSKSWTSEGDLPQSVLDDGIDGLADFIAGYYVQKNVSAGLTTMEITVTGITGVDQYARVLKYLESLNAVASVEVTKVETGEVSYSLDVHGGNVAVSQAISLGRTLAAVADSSGEYRLVP